MGKTKDESSFSVLDALSGQLSNPFPQATLDDDSAIDLDNPVAVIHNNATDDDNLPLDDETNNIDPGTNPEDKNPEDQKPIKDDDTKQKDDNHDDDFSGPVDGEEEQVGLFFDAFNESLGWQASDSKPKTIEELINYMGEVVENSKSDYASDEVREINEFISNGGKLEDYLKINSEMSDYNNLDLEDTFTQKKVVSEFLSAQGLSKEAIAKRVNRYEDAGMLEDEAKDAVDYLKEFKEKEKAEVLKQQEQFRIQEEQKQEKFYKDVTTSIDSLSSIAGMNIPASDKAMLKDYLFKTDANGQSQYEKDFSQNLVKNLLESAYFTMKGDALVKSANKKGETNAINKFRQKIKSSSTSGRSSHEIDNSSAKPIWSAVADTFGSANITI